MSAPIVPLSTLAERAAANLERYRNDIVALAAAVLMDRDGASVSPGLAERCGRVWVLEDDDGVPAGVLHDDAGWIAYDPNAIAAHGGLVGFLRAGQRGRDNVMQHAGRPEGFTVRQWGSLDLRTFAMRDADLRAAIWGV